MPIRAKAIFTYKGQFLAIKGLFAFLNFPHVYPKYSCSLWVAL